MSKLLPLVVAVPVIAACLLLGLSRWLPGVVTACIAIAASTATAAIAIALLVDASNDRVVNWVGGWRPSGASQVGVTLVADPLAAGVCLTAALLVLAAQVYGIGYFDDVAGVYPGIMLLFLAGMTGFAISADLFDLFVFFELMGSAAYVLTGMKVEEGPSVQGALNFGVINSLGAYLSLMGIGLTYLHTGQLGLAPIGAYLDTHRASPVVTAAFALVIIGLLVKAAIAPMHFWLADAHAVAPTPVCVLFSGLMVELGLYGLARIYWTAFRAGLDAGDVRRLLLTLGVLTAVVGAIMCPLQRHIKRMLAYSTLTHSGLFLIAVGTLTEPGTTGAAVYILGHAAVKSALFLLTGLLLNGFGTVDEGELFGRGRSSQLSRWCFVAGGLALAGMPPFGISLGKALSEEAAGTEHAWLIGLYVLASAITGGTVLRMTLRVFFGAGYPPPKPPSDTTSGKEEREVPASLDRPPLIMSLPILLLLGVGLALGVWPAVGRAVSQATARLIDHAGYLAAVLHRAPSKALPTSAAEWTASGVWLGIASAAIAVGLAIAAVYLPGRLSRRQFARLVDAGRSGAHVLRRLHSGHLGDYVAWLVFAVAGTALLLGVTA